MLKVDLASFFVTLVDWEIDDPGERKAVQVSQLQLCAYDVTGFACDAFERLWFTAKEECSVAHAQTQLKTDRLCTFWSDVLGKRSSGFHAAFDFACFQLGLCFFHCDAHLLGDSVGSFFTPEDVAHARQTFFLCKYVHPVTEFA